MFTPLEVDISSDDKNNITATLNYPTYPEDPKNIKVVFDVYLVDKKEFNIMQGVSMMIKNTQFSYRLSAQEDSFKGVNSSNTIVKKIDKDTLLTGYTKVIGYLQKKINDSSMYASKIAEILDTVKLYAVGYVIVDDQNIRPDIAMKDYSLSENLETEHDDFMIESIKTNLSINLKDKINFSKCFIDTKNIKVSDIIAEHSIQPLPTPRSEDRFVGVIQ